jgi:hypothetical protein
MNSEMKLATTTSRLNSKETMRFITYALPENLQVGGGAGWRGALSGVERSRWRKRRSEQARNQWSNDMRNVLIVVLGWLVLWTTVHAASFDCAKATTKVEHLICDNPEISKLDDELAVRYVSILNDRAHAQEVRSEQAQWIKYRNYCENKTCLSALYRARIQELVDAPKYFTGKRLYGLANSSEKPDFDAEVDKFEFMRRIVKGSELYPAEPNEFCQRFLKDFRNGEGVEAIEPDVRTNDESDPRLTRWNQCKGNDANGPGAFGGIQLDLGGPPYRYYQIDLDGNPQNGKEDVIYTDFQRGSSGGVVGENGYFWVDLNACVVIGGSGSVMTHGLELLRPNAYLLNVLVKYRGSYRVVDISPSGHTGFTLGTGALGDMAQRRSCLWRQKP